MSKTLRLPCLLHGTCKATVKQFGYWNEQTLLPWKWTDSKKFIKDPQRHKRFYPDLSSPEYVSISDNTGCSHCSIPLSERKYRIPHQPSQLSLWSVHVCLYSKSSKTWWKFSKFISMKLSLKELQHQTTQLVFCKWLSQHNILTQGSAVKRKPVLLPHPKQCIMLIK